jgi:hypothetical protein
MRLIRVVDATPAAPALACPVRYRRAGSEHRQLPDRRGSLMNLILLVLLLLLLLGGGGGYYYGGPAVGGGIGGLVLLILVLWLLLGNRRSV